MIGVMSPLEGRSEVLCGMGPKARKTISIETTIAPKTVDQTNWWGGANVGPDWARRLPD